MPIGVGDPTPIYNQMTERAAYLVAQGRFLKLAAKLTREVGNIDEPDTGAAPQVILNLGTRQDAL